MSKYKQLKITYPSVLNLPRNGDAREIASEILHSAGGSRFFSFGRKNKKISLTIKSGRGNLNIYILGEEKLLNSLRNNLKEKNVFILDEIRDVEMSNGSYVGFHLKTKNNPVFGLNFDMNLMDQLLKKLSHFRNSDLEVICKMDFDLSNIASPHREINRQLEKIEKGQHRASTLIKLLMNKNFRYEQTHLDKDLLKYLREINNRLLFKFSFSAFVTEKNNGILKDISVVLHKLSNSPYNFVETSKYFRTSDYLRKENNNYIYISDTELSSFFSGVDSEGYENNNFLGFPIGRDNISPRRDLSVGSGLYKSEVKDFYIPYQHKFMHSAVVGGTGSGKTQHLIRQFISEIKQDHRAGGIFFDISDDGDASKLIISNVQEERLDEVIIIDVVNPNFKWGYFKKLSGETDALAIDRITDTTHTIMSSFGDGINIESYINAIVELCYKKNMKISEVDKIMNGNFIEENLEIVSDNNKKRLKDLLSQKGKNDVQPALKRFRTLLDSENLRSILDTDDITFDLASAMEESKIVLLKISNISEITLKTMQSMILSSVKTTMLRRSLKSNPFFITLDEFSVFTGASSINTIMNQGRKFKVGLTVAGQYVDQFGTNSGAILGNVRTFIALDDDETKTQVRKILGINNFELDRYQAYIKYDKRSTYKINMFPVEQEERNFQDASKIYNEKRDERLQQNKVRHYNNDETQDVKRDDKKGINLFDHI